MICRWSGAGYVKCTVEYRKNHPILCRGCKNNLDEICEEIVTKNLPLDYRPIDGFIKQSEELPNE
jgi:hypothetical protein